MSVYLSTKAIAKAQISLCQCTAHVLILLIILSLLELFELLLICPEALWIRHVNSLQESRHVFSSDPIETLFLNELLHHVDESLFERASRIQIVKVAMHSTRYAHTDFFLLEVDVGNESDPSVIVEDRDAYFPELELVWYFHVLNLIL
jgi:hypothetical protein